MRQIPSRLEDPEGCGRPSKDGQKSSHHRSQQQIGRQILVIAAAMLQMWCTARMS